MFSWDYLASSMGEEQTETLSRWTFSLNYSTSLFYLLVSLCDMWTNWSLNLLVVWLIDTLGFDSPGRQWTCCVVVPAADQLHATRCPTCHLFIISGIHKQSNKIIISCCFNLLKSVGVFKWIPSKFRTECCAEPTGNDRRLS